MNNSKFDEIYDEYKHGDEEIIDTVIRAFNTVCRGSTILQQEVVSKANLMTTNTYTLYCDSLNARSIVIQDLSAFIIEYYRRINPKTGLGVTEQQFNEFTKVLEKELA